MIVTVRQVWTKRLWSAVPINGSNIYNKGIRNTILFREDELNSGDLLMVAKNNYFWTEGCKEIDFIANGDYSCGSPCPSGA